MTPLAGPADELPRGLFGYRIPTVNRYIKSITSQDDLELRPFGDEVQRLTMEIARLKERRRTLNVLVDHIRLECERLNLQLAQERLNQRFADAGVRQEIARLEQEHLSRLALLDASKTRADLEAQSYEKQLWQLTESLTRILQDSQSVANQQLSLDSAESVWQDFARTVLGTQDLRMPIDTLVPGRLVNRRIAPGVVQVSTRQGERLGHLTGVVLSVLPPAIVAYRVDEALWIAAEDVQVLRMGHITVVSQYKLLDESDVLALYSLETTSPKGEAFSESSPAALPTHSADPVEDAKLPDLTIEPDRKPQPEARVQQLLASEGFLRVASTKDESLPVDLRPSFTGVDAKPLPFLPHDRFGTVESSPLNLDQPDAPQSGERTLKAAKPSVAVGGTVKASQLPDDSPRSTSPIPSPSWFDTASSTSVETECELALPGVSEVNPPAWHPAPPLSTAQVPTEGDALPGLTGRTDLPAPSWTDAGPVASKSPVPDPATGPSPAPQTDHSPELNESGSLDVRTFLFGKRVGQDIRDSDSNPIARAGDMITPELVQRVEQAGFLPDLIVHMVF